ncbi:MAG: TetR/AcrR family transcriptional regulator [Verrucomicrobia bacterium]|nr:TetR/AcrR family transcriptional regulator [Verrucomicrobiota bacterium]
MSFEASMPPESSEPALRDRILRAYMDYVLNENRQPPSVYIFSKNLGIAETEFYQIYSSFDAVEADFWLRQFETARKKITTDPAWEPFKFRERALLFAFTLIESLLSDRSFALFSLRSHQSGEVRSAPLRRMHQAFDGFFEPLVSEAIEHGELANRRFLRDHYVDALWNQTLFVLRFWGKDSSEGFESTDEAIEKGFNLTIDLMSRSAIDAAVDYGKFLARNRSDR